MTIDVAAALASRDLSWRDAAIAALSGIAVTIDAPLSRRTTFGIGGPADLLVQAERDDDVARVLALAAARDLPLFVLGGGSNLLVDDTGVRGLVLLLGGSLAELRIADDGRRIDVGCGCSFPRLTKTCIELGWPGAVGWIGTPGQVGGALLMNAGSKQGELGDVVDTVVVAEQGAVRSLDRAACAFSYRSSVFQRGRPLSEGSDNSADPEANRFVLTRAILKCDNASTNFSGELAATANELLERRHRTQPKLRSAGSLFKNPPGDFAGRLIQAAGLKGYSVGRAQVSPVHANFVVNLGGATASDVVALADHVRGVVADRFGVTLEWEVRRVGGDPRGSR
ncbi:MAG: UDP-N-acetylmuramate dehydrogenase [Deltaproteobacteria bacterium]|nr:UDP-N-acetylmuramate dehydrogenase [Deltaproteobacteria bacterium]